MKLSFLVFLNRLLVRVIARLSLDRHICTRSLRQAFAASSLCILVDFNVRLNVSRHFQFFFQSAPLGKFVNRDQAIGLWETCRKLEVHIMQSFDQTNDPDQERYQLAGWLDGVHSANAIPRDHQFNG